MKTTIGAKLVEDCKDHTFVWFSDKRDGSAQLGEYLIETYFCTQCGEMKSILYRLDNEQ